jgi:hypothetical protein
VTRLYDRPEVQAPESFPTGAAAAVLTARRLECCDQLVRSVSVWLLAVTPRTDAPWPRQRQIELVLRARQSMLGVVLLSRHELWMPAYAAARMLLEDAAVAHWLAVHPDLRVLEARWSEHLSAMRYGDIKAQRELGLEVDDVNAAWLVEQDEESVRRVAERHRFGAAHWTGKSVKDLVDGAAARSAPGRDDWAGRTHMLASTLRRMQPLISAGVHHSPAGSQNWYASANELFPDALRVASLAFGLHAAVALEDLAVERFGELQELINRQAENFVHAPAAKA